MNRGIIDKIKDAEDKAQKIIDQAAISAQQIIADARIKADEELHKGLTEAEIKADKLSDDIIKGAFKQTSQIIESSQYNVSDIKAKACKNLNAAKDAIVEEIKKRYGCIES